MTTDERILWCMKRHVAREHQISRVQAPLRIWFLMRMDYLEREYLAAINAADNIIGKQWLFDQRPRFRLRYYSSAQKALIDAYRDGNPPTTAEEIKNG